VRRAHVTVAIAYAAVLAFLPAPAAPAGAVGSAGAAASNFATRLRAVTPRPPGVDVAVVEIGNRMELVNRSRTDVVVLGYENEPYLRIGPRGVFENRRSPATYLNRNRQASVPVPESADATAPPDWRRISTERTARWFDHRVHWMGAINPPAVRREPAERHIIVPEWVVTFQYGDTPFEASGELVWEPSPSPLPWLLLAVVPVGAVVLLLGAAVWVRSRSWWPRPLAAGVAALIAVSGAGAVGRAWESAAETAGRVAELARSSPLLLASWAVAAVAVVLLLGRRRAGLLATVLAAAGIAVFGGAAALSDLSRSQIATVLPAGLARATVALSLGLGAALVVVTIVAWRQAPEATPVPASRSQ
jgi:hypothetical protein